MYAPVLVDENIWIFYEREKGKQKRPWVPSNKIMRKMMVINYAKARLNEISKTRGKKKNKKEGKGWDVFMHNNGSQITLHSGLQVATSAIALYELKGENYFCLFVNMIFIGRGNKKTRGHLKLSHLFSEQHESGWEKSDPLVLSLVSTQFH